VPACVYRLERVTTTAIGINVDWSVSGVAPGASRSARCIKVTETVPDGVEDLASWC